MLQKLFLAIIAMATLTSCEQITDEFSTTTTKSSETTLQKKQVQFVMKGITEEYSTRATLANAGCTDLYVWEGTTLLAHKVSTDEDFDSPTVTLTYGSHDMTFLASKASSQSWGNGVWSCSKINDTFATTVTVTISGGSSSSRQVQLTRRVCGVQVKTTDKVPATVCKVHYKIASHNSLSSALMGGDAFTIEGTEDISASQQKTWTKAYYMMPESASEEEDCAVMVEFLGAGDAVLYHYERTVKVKVNRITNLTGNFFAGDENVVSVNEKWDDPLNVNL